MNKDPNCGCTPPSGTDTREYLLVKSTASEASTCGAPSGEGSTAACPKQEPTYDVSMSAFVIPIHPGSTPMEVCNASIYSLLSWVHFSSPVAALQVTNITGNILTLTNKCPNGEPIDNNPVNVVIEKGTSFVVGPAPQCNSDEQDQERINSALASATELCMPNMKTSSSTAVIRPVGKIESDSADSGVKKCIQAIFGILFSAGTPILTNLIKKTAFDLNYRRLAKHKTTNEVVHLDNYSEGVTSSASYALMVSKDTEKIVPTYFMDLFRDVLIHSNADLNDFHNWNTMPGDQSYEQNFSLKDDLEDLFNNRDHVFAMVNVDFGMHTHVADYVTLRCLVNDLEVGRVVINNQDATNPANVTSVTIPIKILKAGNYPLNLKLLVSKSGTTYYYLKLMIVGAYY